MGTKKITLNELRTLVKQIIKEDNLTSSDGNEKDYEILHDLIKKNNFHMVDGGSDYTTYYNESLGIRIIFMHDKPSWSEVRFDDRITNLLNDYRTLYVKDVFPIKFTHNP
jgi:hypothetical protein